MRFAWAKGNKECKKCGETIKRGERQVHITFKSKQGFWIHYYYHIDHYLEYLSDYITGWFKAHPNVQKKMGRRPVITYDREERRRLMALYRYHRKRDNMDRMITVLQEILRLSYGVSPYTVY